MYSCEALIAASEATGETRYLHRAERLARHITVRHLAHGDVAESENNIMPTGVWIGTTTTMTAATCSGRGDFSPATRQSR